MQSLHNFNKEHEWALISSAWGDIFCSLISVKQHNLKKVIYYGYMPGKEINDFLKAQDFIDETIIINTHNKDQLFYDFWESAVRKDNNYEIYLNKVLTKNNIKLDYNTIFNCCCDITGVFEPTFQLKNLNLPDYLMAWAKKFVEDNGLYKFILVNPYSIHSSKKEEHWPHWHEYLNWLFEQEKYKIVFVGYNFEFEIKSKHKNVINLLNKLPSNMHVLALSMYADSVITTSNNLAHWCNAQNILCTTMCNSRVSTVFDYFGRILSSKNIYKIENHESLNFAKMITIKINLKYYDNKYLPERNFYLEDFLSDEKSKYLFYLNNKYQFKINDILSTLNLMPYMKTEDLGKSWFFNFKTICNLSRAIECDNYYEVGTAVGYGLISISATNENIKNVGWCDEQNYIFNSNHKVQTNLDFFNERYNRPIEYSYIDKISLLPFHIKNYDVICFNSRFIDKSFLLKNISMIMSIVKNKLFIFNDFVKNDFINCESQDIFDNLVPLNENLNLFIYDSTHDKKYLQKIKNLKL